MRGGKEVASCNSYIELKLPSLGYSAGQRIYDVLVRSWYSQIYNL